MYQRLIRTFAPLALAVAFTIALTFWIGRGDMWWLSGGAVLYMGGKLMLANSVMYGHGVDRKPRFIGMPLRLGVFYAVGLVLAITFAMPFEGLSQESNYAFISVGFGLFLGWVTARLDWHFVSSKKTFYFNEERERATMRGLGRSEAEIERDIKEGKRLGMFPPNQ